MKWSDEAWDTTLPVYEKILEHPFIHGLIDGTLDHKRFIFYVQQDAIYLASYGKVLIGIASKLSDPAHIKTFIGFADESMAVENELHNSFIIKMGNSSDTKSSPSCLLYTSYLLRLLGNAPIEVILAGVLPCFRIYKEVGGYILEHQTKDKNPYQDWINTYGGEDFENSVNKAIAICNEIAEKCTEEQRQAMTDAYAMCSKLEWMFWDSAWRLEKWAV